MYRYPLWVAEGEKRWGNKNHSGHQPTSQIHHLIPGSFKNERGIEIYFNNPSDKLISQFLTFQNSAMRRIRTISSILNKVDSTNAPWTNFNWKPKISSFTYQQKEFFTHPLLPVYSLGQVQAHISYILLSLRLICIGCTTARASTIFKGRRGAPFPFCF